MSTEVSERWHKIPHSVGMIGDLDWSQTIALCSDMDPVLKGSGHANPVLSIGSQAKIGTSLPLHIWQKQCHDVGKKPFWSRPFHLQTCWCLYLVICQGWDSNGLCWLQEVSWLDFDTSWHCWYTFPGGCVDQDKNEKLWWNPVAYMIATKSVIRWSFALLGSSITVTKKEQTCVIVWQNRRWFMSSHENSPQSTYTKLARAQGCLSFTCWKSSLKSNLTVQWWNMSMLEV